MWNWQRRINSYDPRYATTPYPASRKFRKSIVSRIPVYLDLDTSSDAHIVFCAAEIFPIKLCMVRKTLQKVIFSPRNTSLLFPWNHFVRRKKSKSQFNWWRTEWKTARKTMPTHTHTHTSFHWLRVRFEKMDTCISIVVASVFRSSSFSQLNADRIENIFFPLFIICFLLLLLCNCNKLKFHWVFRSFCLLLIFCIRCHSRRSFSSTCSTVSAQVERANRRRFCCACWCCCGGGCRRHRALVCLRAWVCAMCGRHTSLHWISVHGLAAILDSWVTFVVRPIATTLPSFESHLFVFDLAFFEFW